MSNNLTTVYHKKPQKVYDLVKQLLEEYSETRDSDRKLIWKMWEELDLTTSYRDGTGGSDFYISQDNFMDAPSCESIRRCRQKIQEKYENLRGSKYIQDKRSEKALDKGTYIYREEVQTAMF